MLVRLSLIVCFGTFRVILRTWQHRQGSAINDVYSPAARQLSSDTAGASSALRRGSGLWRAGNAAASTVVCDETLI